MSLKTFFDFRETRDEAKPFLAHLEDLRATLIKIAVALAVTMTLCFVFRGELAGIVQRPLIDVDPVRAANLQSLGVADSFTISLELSFYGGIVLAFPFILLFLAEFILPALNAAEKRILYPVALVGFGLFLGGTAFCYSVVLPQTLEFFFNDARAMHWQPTWTVREYYSFATQFLIGFGLAFELPLVVLVLVKLGIVDHALLKRTRAYALVVIFFVAAIITPTTDMLTLLLMAGPMYVLYEICIAISWLMGERGGE
ncbi:MAG: twin-arginine translocase subunit TatC [Terrimicrobiaceae bacterium]|jgi:sec-independent protein translocase protein TatC|nr:twin-arginine translocase subunit TatC [Terrimicrobiaceae bacterium]